MTQHVKSISNNGREFRDQIDALSSYTYLTDEVAYLPGETVMGEEFEEFHLDEESLQEQIIRTYYKEVN